VLLTISDDGRGIDSARVLAKALEKGLIRETDELSEQEVYQLIFKAGFSTAEHVTAISGRGVGMDVVKRNIQNLGGRIQVLSEPGVGTRFIVTLPLTLAIAPALLVRVAHQTFALPLSAVEETVRLYPNDIKTVREKEVFQTRDRVVPLFRLKNLFNLPSDSLITNAKPVVIVGQGDQQLGLVVDELLGQQDVVVKPLGPFLGQLPGIGGATILGDGLVALIVDVSTLLVNAGSEL
jgi:two-component system chemotaxis sensor kinase CheA